MVCDTCSTASQAQNYALQNTINPSLLVRPSEYDRGEISIDSEHYEDIAVVNTVNRTIYTFQTIVISGAGYESKHATLINNSANLILALDAYLNLKRELESLGVVHYSAVPAGLSGLSGLSDAGALSVITSSSLTCEIKQGSKILAGVPIVSTGSARDLADDVTMLQVGNEARAFLVSKLSINILSSSVRAGVSDLILKKPLLVTTTFPDKSFVQWKVGSILSSVTLTLLKDSARDANCNLINLAQAQGESSHGGRYVNWVGSTTTDTGVTLATLRTCFVTQVKLTEENGSLYFTPQQICEDTFHPLS